MKKVIIILLLIFTTIFFTSCNRIKAYTIDIDVLRKGYYKGECGICEVTIYPTYHTDIKLKWSVSDSKLVKIDNDGRFEIIEESQDEQETEVTIYCKTNSGVVGTITINVFKGKRPNTDNLNSSSIPYSKISKRVTYLQDPLMNEISNYYNKLIVCNQASLDKLKADCGDEKLIALLNQFEEKYKDDILNDNITLCMLYIDSYYLYNYKLDIQSISWDSDELEIKLFETFEEIGDSQLMFFKIDFSFYKAYNKNMAIPDTIRTYIYYYVSYKGEISIRW